jgi:hypothetical protein
MNDNRKRSAVSRFEWHTLAWCAAGCSCCGCPCCWCAYQTMCHETIAQLQALLGRRHAEQLLYEHA